MHDRTRLVAGSFLVKDLHPPWQAGASWFRDTLGWQWVAGCGADAAPYFRVFDPVTEDKRFDPDGAFVRRRVPELVDHGEARSRALAAYEVVELAR